MIIPDKKKKIGHQQKWTLEEIRQGMEYFKSLNGNYPRIQDFDTFEYLPSARLIQRNFEGISNVRKALSLNTGLNLTMGEHRAAVARRTHSQAVNYEESFYRYLISNIPEVRVHEHKILRPGYICCDFFIYKSDNEGIVIDLFYAQDIKSLGGVVSIKMKRYSSIHSKIYFVLVNNEKIDQKEIDELIRRKDKKLPQNISVMTEKFFKKTVLLELAAEPNKQDRG
ncbi:MAG: hypothetical protein ABSF56_02950 [Minisyncoccia bacterium]|jgi:hypothetical protein